MCGGRGTHDGGIEERVRVGCLGEKLVDAEEGVLGDLAAAREVVDLALVCCCNGRRVSCVRAKAEAGGGSDAPLRSVLKTGPLSSSGTFLNSARVGRRVSAQALPLPARRAKEGGLLSSDERVEAGRRRTSSALREGLAADEVLL